MSIINQMLRDLDARGAASNNPPEAGHRVPSSASRPGLRKAMLLVLLLSVVGVAGYLALPPTPSVGKQPAEVAVKKREPIPVPAAMSSPPILDVPQPVAESPHAAPVAAPKPVLPRQEIPLVLGAKMSRSLIKPQSVGEGTFITRPPAQAEPAVVKKMAEMSPEAEAQQLYDDAQALRRSGKIEAAMGKYRLALERKPGIRNARIQLAGLLQENGQAESALSLLKAGYEYQQDGGLAIATGRLLADQGQRDEALVWLERGRDSLRPTDHALMGALLSQALRYEDAVKSYQRALAVDPSQGGWLLGLGLALESLGRIDAAQTAYRNALERGDFKPEVVKFLRQKSGATAQ